MGRERTASRRAAGAGEAHNPVCDFNDAALAPGAASSVHTVQTALARAAAA